MDRNRRSRGRAADPQHPIDGMSVAVVWGRVIVGLALAGIGGVAFGHAWTNEAAPMWVVGGITLLVGVLLVLSGVYARSHPVAPPVKLPVPEEPAGAREPLVPLLGAILVYKYRYITQKQLQQTLAEQMHSQPRRRLGEILVLKGILTASQLEEALTFQHSTTAKAEPA